MAIELDKLVVGLVIFGLVFSAGFLFYTSVGDTYGVNITNNDVTKLNDTVAEANELGNEMQEKVFGTEVTVTNFLNKLFYGSYLSLKLMKNSFDLFIDIIRVSVTALGIPPIFQTAAVTIVVVLILFALIYLFMRIIPVS